MKKEKYVKPFVLESIVLEFENEILHSSVVTEDTTVETTGQEYTTYDFSGEEFNHLWEE